MKTVNDVLTIKGHGISSTTADASVYDAIRVMADNKIGALVVIEDGKVVGMITETDYTRKVVLKGRSSSDTLVKDIMTTPVLYVEPEQEIKDCMMLMTEKRTRHLPVMDEGKLIGLISIGDAVKSIIDEQQFTIDQLERYISGS